MSGITAAELAAMRAEASALVMPDTCVISYEGTANVDGFPSRVETIRGTVACALAAASRMSYDAVLADREGSLAYYTLTVAYDTSIEAEDKVVCDTKTYRVVMLHDNQSFSISKRALVVGVSAT